ncbi:MAG: hypothetical protein KC468_34725 [Myxococcales bacterium]|nr:hypothetical protein [Myxococcales bacterium]
MDAKYAALAGVSAGMGVSLAVAVIIGHRRRRIGSARQAVVESVARSGISANHSVRQQFRPWRAIAKHHAVVGALSANEFEDLLWNTAASDIGDPSTVAKALLDVGYEPVSKRLQDFIEFYRGLPPGYER